MRQAAGDFAQQLVAGLVAERVVDALELVEVEIQQRRERVGAQRVCDRLLEPIA